MTGILIATHGTLADGLLDAVQLIIGEQADVITLGLKHEDSIEEFTDKVKSSIQRLGKSGDVLVFTDLKGASPYNATVKCVSTIKDVHFRVLTGTNLGMLIEVFLKRMLDTNVSVDDLADLAKIKGRESVTELFDEIKTIQQS